MKKNLFAGVVGGIVLFLWGWIAWIVLPIHSDTLWNLPNEDVVVSALQTAPPAAGVYTVPGMPRYTAEMSDDQKAAATKEWEEKQQRGPVALIVLHPTGKDPMMASQMITGLIISMLTAFLAAWFLSRSTAVAGSFFQRVVFCGMLGVFASFVVHLMYWNWFNFPMNYTTAMVADTVIGWLLAGIAISAIVKSPKTQA